jgi:phytanoyl-CoA hydroxylase
MKAKKKNSINQNKYNWSYENPQFIESFVEFGFVIVKNVFPPDLIDRMYEFVSSRYCEYKKEFVDANPRCQIPFVGITKKLIRELEGDSLYNELTHTSALLEALEKILGPDLSKICATGFFPVDPDDKSSPIFKALHQEAWTGIGPDDVVSWTPLHDVDIEDTLLVVPGSHLFGLLPNRNRKLLPVEGFEIPEAVPLKMQKGDIVFFHSLLLHGTSGKGEQIRYAVQINYRNTFTPMTMQQKGYGFENLKQGPMTRIRQVLGNDYLTPLRTYGGEASNYEEYY